MHSLLPWIWTKAARLARSVAFASLCGIAAVRGAEIAAEAPATEDDGAIPQPLRDDIFDALMASPPFTRTLGVSDSLILTGVAYFEDEIFATLLDTKTMESQTVSKAANFRGWQLVGVGGNPSEIQTCAAKIQIPGGEIVTIRYQPPPPRSSRSKSGGSSGSSGSSSSGGSGPGGNAPPLTSSQLAEAKNAAVNYKQGFNADGYPKEPPPEMVAKLSRLSTSQREEINRTMFGYRNQGLGLDERRKIYEGLVDRSLQRR